MCLILMGIEADPRYRLVLAANRDEFFDRPAQPADFWSDDLNVVGGKDLRRGGSWLGVTKQGMVAAVTNIRNPFDLRKQPRSRGELVARYLRGDHSPTDYGAIYKTHVEAYRGFNLLLFGKSEFEDNEYYCFSNQGDYQQILRPGVHGVSNAGLNTPWPKVQRGKEKLEEWIQSRGSAEDLLQLLSCQQAAPDEELPSTGVGIEKERFLSPIFLNGSDYGTRASTIVLITPSGELTFIEREYGSGGVLGSTKKFELEVKPKWWPVSK